MHDTSSLLQQYEKLSAFEQSLLQFLSIIYEPAHTSLIVNCLRKLDLRNPRGNKPTAANLSHYFAKFEKLGLLTKDRQCTEEIVEILSKRAVREGTFEGYAEIIQEEAQVSYYYGKWTTRCWRAMREMRIGIYTQQFDIIDDATEFINSQCLELIAGPPAAVRIMTQPFDREWFQTLPSSFQFFLLNTVFNYSQSTLADYPEVAKYLENEEEFSELTVDEQVPFKRLLFNELVCRGRLQEARDLVEIHNDSFSGTGAMGTICFLEGKGEEALQHFNQYLTFLRTYSEDEKVALFGPSGLFYILTRLQCGTESEYHEIANTIGIALSLFRNARENDAYNYLATVVNSHINQTPQQDPISLPELPEQNILTIVFAGLCQYWMNSAI